MSKEEQQILDTRMSKLYERTDALLEDGLTWEQVNNTINKKYDKLLNEKYLFEQSMGSQQK
jgi:hypothetical protein